MNMTGGYKPPGKARPELIVMLTHNDVTVPDAAEIFRQCRNSRAKFWGFKELPLPLPQMKELYASMKECGKTTFLEVVAYTEEACLEGARMGAACGVDYLLGTTYAESIHACCRENGMRYLPFVGDITGRPSVLGGTIESIIEQGRQTARLGVDGLDLLGYRFIGDARELNRRFVQEMNLPVVLAGSVNSFERLDEVREADPWAFTIGGAFFENRFGNEFARQIDTVVEYINR